MSVLRFHPHHMSVLRFYPHHMSVLRFYPHHMSVLRFYPHHMSVLRFHPHLMSVLRTYLISCLCYASILITRSQPCHIPTNMQYKTKMVLIGEVIKAIRTCYHRARCCAHLHLISCLFYTMYIFTAHISFLTNLFCV
ncbi:hypothetical protein VCUG_00928 [Vavraia culicis subsp. floridensis]|uniref:Uncharacterized protein n=1 Tax=Vavraia culicis (isolate floridensis) TaxID=948595 RepID=L2GWY3_VAVCU|nr:uncharacterized protein VCUG_00928 [Vavraia culicis subsp. floridensis]ELA47605.1 hypothetical protein VCUG_00928 [Vavraia culicis subsp. floridensis]